LDLTGSIDYASKNFQSFGASFRREGKLYILLLKVLNFISHLSTREQMDIEIYSKQFLAVAYLNLMKIFSPLAVEMPIYLNVFLVIAGPSLFTRRSHV